MTFKNFENIIKERRPDIFKVWEHKDFTSYYGSDKTIHVAVKFSEYGKVYNYTGTYCEVLNKLKINAIYKHNYIALQNALNNAIAENGKKCKFFNIIIDNTQRIADLTKELQDIENNYIIV